MMGKVKVINNQNDLVVDNYDDTRPRHHVFLRKNHGIGYPRLRRNRGAAPGEHAGDTRRFVPPGAASLFRNADSVCKACAPPQGQRPCFDEVDGSRHQILTIGQNLVSVNGIYVRRTNFGVG